MHQPFFLREFLLIHILMTTYINGLQRLKASRVLYGKVRRCIYIYIYVYLSFSLGGIFQLRLQFSEYYNTCPPKIHFMTIPFHPNGMLEQFLHVTFITIYSNKTTIRPLFIERTILITI